MKSPWIDNKVEGIRIIKKLRAKRCGIEMFWRNSSLYAKKLREYNFLDALIGVNAHEEVIKSSSEILELMYDYHELSIDNLNTIWNKCLENNGAISNSLIGVLIEITPSFGIPTYRELFKWLENTPPKKFTEALVKFAEVYTVSAMKIPAEKQGVGKKLYNIDLFWNLTVDPEAEEIVKDLGLESLSRLIKNDLNLKLEYCYMVGNSISEQKNVERSLQVLQKFDFVAILITKNDTTLDNYLNTFQIITSIVNECVSLHKEIKRKLNVSPNLRKDIMNNCLTKQSGLTFKSQLMLFMDFLHISCAGSKNIVLNLDQFDSLWNCFYFEQLSEDHCNILWETLNKWKLDSNPMLTTYGFFKGLDKAKEFYIQFLSNPGKLKPGNISEKGIECFRRYYNLINEQSASIETQIGIELLWSIAMEAETQSARKLSSSWLINIYKSKIAEIIQEKKDLVVSFLENLLSKGGKKTANFQAALFILEEFNNMYHPCLINNSVEGKNCEQFIIDPAEFEEPPLYIINVILPGSLGEIEVIISQSLTTFHLIRKIANHLKVLEDRVFIFYQNKDITNEPLNVINSNRIFVNLQVIQLLKLF